MEWDGPATAHQAELPYGKQNIIKLPNVPAFFFRPEE
jgi:hypothetical protein